MVLYIWGHMGSLRPSRGRGLRPPTRRPSYARTAHQLRPAVAVPRTRPTPLRAHRRCHANRRPWRLSPHGSIHQNRTQKSAIAGNGGTGVPSTPAAPTYPPLTAPQATVVVSKGISSSTVTPFGV